MGVNPQEQHYDAMHDSYAAHYYDAVSNEYRRRFILKPLCASLDLQGASVAELACGDGHNSVLFRELFPTAQLEGFDISAAACAEYERNTGSKAHKVDLTRRADFAPTYDAAMIIGGLHHCVADLPATMKNVASMLKPGAKFIMYEPSADFFLEPLRRAWYRHDKYFDSATEWALKHDEILKMAGPDFKLDRKFHVGGPAYIFLLNSLVTRTPLEWKKRLAKPLFWSERAWNALPFKAMFPVFGAVWTRF